MSSLKYIQAIKILNHVNQSTKIVFRSTEIFEQLMKYLGNPQNSYNKIHVTGTNGKGSVSLKTAEILKYSGYKVGLYTSPSIITFRQRIQINSENISKDNFAKHFMTVHQAAQRKNLDISFFQYLTGAAFMYFKEQKCDLSVIQVGLGGMHDTTNIITPLLSVITSLGIDHTQILGNTIDLIAEQKAGIIKPNIPVVLGQTAKHPKIYECAKKNNSKVYQVQNQSQDKILSFQKLNNKTVRQICQCLINQYNFKLSKQSIEKGLLAKQPCRMQQFSKQKMPSWIKKRMFMDVGHNPQAMQNALNYYRTQIKKNSNDKLIVVFGCSSGKDFKQSLALLQKQAQVIYLVQAKNPRALSINQLSASIGLMKKPQKYRIIGDGNIQKSLLYASADQNGNNLLIIGSFFIMPQTLNFLDPELVKQSQVLNQVYILKNK